MGLISEIICSDLVLERSEYHSDEVKEPGAEEEEEEKFRVLQEKCKILQERKLQEITEYLSALEELGEKVVKARKALEGKSPAREAQRGKEGQRRGEERIICSVIVTIAVPSMLSGSYYRTCRRAPP